MKNGLNLWQRLGVVSSLVFIFGYGTFFMLDWRGDQARTVYKFMENYDADCSGNSPWSTMPSILEKCKTSREVEFNQLRSAFLPNSVVKDLAIVYAAFTVIALVAWLVVYAVVYTIRWIWAGRKAVVS